MKQLSESIINAHRPIPFYYITTRDPAELTYEKFYADLSDMKAKGYGGVIPFNRPPEGFLKEHFLSEAWFFMMDNCIRAAADLGLTVWINDDYDAPPGDVGDRIEKIAPHLKQKRVVLDENGQVQVQDVDWGFPAYEHPESAALFHKLVYEEYKRRYGQYFGTTIKGIFSDADSRRVNSEVLFGKEEMKEYFPWTDDFADTFQKRYGYDVMPYLPSIIRRETSDQARDYWEHAGERYFGWFESNYQWCKENGLEYTFHTSDTAPVRVETSYFNSAFAEGKAIDAGSHCDWPGTDHERLQLNGNIFCRPDLYQDYYAVWGGNGEHSRVPNFYDTYADLRAKQAQSGAYLYDKKGAMCEMHAMVGWNASYKELHNIAAWQMMQGVTFVVLQAYHYRLHNTTKYFATLSFGPHCHTDFDMKAYNDFIAENSSLCEQGKLKVDLALLDPTDSIWRGDGDSLIHLDLCKKLNHFPQGYVIADMKGIRRKAKELKAVVNPDLNLSDADRKTIADLGLKLFEADELDRIEAELPTGISWDGPGELMFMRRELPDGEEMLIVGNIESDDTLQGNLTFNGKTYGIELTSGEMAFFGGGFDKYRQIPKDAVQMALPEEMAVTYEKANVIPLMRWEDPEGNATSPVDPKKRGEFWASIGWVKAPYQLENHPFTLEQTFGFTAEADLKGLELMVCHTVLKHIDSITLDGQLLRSCGLTKFMDDTQLCYRFDVAAGRHQLKLQLNSPFEINDAIFLLGEFDAKVTISKEVSCVGAAYYIRSYLPKKAEIILSQRRDTMQTGLSWTEQGHPFYSGSVTYSFDAEIPESMEKPVLVCPGLRDAAKLKVDGEIVRSRILPPYRFSLPAAGKHHFELTVCNTQANMLEGYCAPSGLTGKPYITE